MSRFVIIGGAALILSVPLSMILPPSIAFENGLIENFQVLWLFGAALFSLQLRRTSRSVGVRSFDLFCALGFVLIAVRELSWGRVFYQIDVDESGPVFVSMADFVWRTEAYTFIVVISLAMLTLLVRSVPFRSLKRVQIPRGMLIIIVIGMTLQYIGEHGYLIGKLSGQTLEELSETVVYMMLPMLCRHYHNHLK